MKKALAKITPTKAGAAAAGSTIGIGGSLAFLVISVPADVGLFTLPEGYVPHVTALVIAIWNRTGGRWLLS